MILMTVKDNDCDGRNDIKDIRVEGATDDELLYSIGVLMFVSLIGTAKATHGRSCQSCQQKTT